MKRGLSALFCLFTISVAQAVPVNLSYINKIPSIRLQASLEAKKHEGDSGPGLMAARWKYYADMDKIVRELIRRYYRKEDFSEETIRSIESHATFVTNIEYPATIAQGASGYDLILVEKKTTDIEVLIPKMVKAVTDEAWDWDAQKLAKFDFTKWLKEWKKADKNLENIFRPYPG